MHPLYFSTILLEPNRWKRDLPKIVAVSEWLDQTAEAGFDGVELFEPHFLLASTEERIRILQHPISKPVYNGYFSLDPAGAIGRSQARSAIAETKARAFKFNFGKSPETWDAESQVLVNFLDELPPHVQAWCECHPGTSVESPGAAGELLSRLDNRVQGILHPFWSADGDFRQWLDLFGDRIVHAHVQIRRTDNAQYFSRLEDQPEMFHRRLEGLLTAGFEGSFSIEFVRGTREPESDHPEQLFAEAVRDRDYLRAAIAQLRAG